MYRKVFFGFWTLAAVLFSLLAAAPASAQVGDNEVVYRAFGKGIHHYNAGEYAMAYDEFSKCIEAETKNPSVYYFRGLSLMYLGREEDAKFDFQKGAEIELQSSVNTQKQIGYDLQFVQGDIRMTLESFRAEAKFAAYQKLREIAAHEENINTTNVSNSVGYWSNEGYVYNADNGETEAVEPEPAVNPEDEGDETTDAAGDDDDDDDTDAFGDDDDDDDTAVKEEPEEEIAPSDDLDLDATGIPSIGDDDDDDAALTSGDDDDDDAAPAAFGDDDDDDDDAAPAAFGDDDDDDDDAAPAAAGDDDDDDDAAPAAAGDDDDDDDDAAPAAFGGDDDDDDAAPAAAGDDDDDDDDAAPAAFGDDDDDDDAAPAAAGDDDDDDAAPAAAGDDDDDDDDTSVEAPEAADEDAFDE